MFCYLERIYLYIYLCIKIDIESIFLGSTFQLGGVIFAPMGHLTCLEAFLVVIICRRVLLASSGWRPEILLNVLQCTRETSLPLQQKVIQHKMSIVLRLRNSALGYVFTSEVLLVLGEVCP